ncbi:hypothetical protein [Alteromonas sp. BMJM2]|uniref:hypothetical protein n=1 Tax=Alteromonas sp. BMJM2 TaxID=2954241 RepID=UPI0022B57AA9|nr:hypothetical protein [Alteromonas sp. BMJM2]
MELSSEQTELYFKITQSKTEAEINADCEPSGISMCIDVTGPLGSFASVEGNDLGDITFDIVDVE